MEEGLQTDEIADDEDYLVEVIPVADDESEDDAKYKVDLPEENYPSDVDATNNDDPTLGDTNIDHEMLDAMEFECVNLIQHLFEYQ